MYLNICLENKMSGENSVLFLVDLLKDVVARNVINN